MTGLSIYRHRTQPEVITLEEQMIDLRPRDQNVLIGLPILHETEAETQDQLLWDRDRNRERKSVLEAWSRDLNIPGDTTKRVYI